MTDLQTLLILYLGGSLLLIGLSIPMIRGRVKPNGLYGFRLPKTLNNPDIWYPANSYAGKWLLASGIVSAVAALGFYLVPGLTVDAYALLCTAVILGTLALSFAMSYRYLRSLD